MSVALILIAIIFCVFTVIRPFKIGKFPINMASGPLIVLVFLLISQVVDLSTIKTGILGVDTLKPWQILIVFFSVAYVSISTDVTGVFDYLAYYITRAVKGDGRKLFIFFFVFAGVLSIFTSNDIVILTLTPIIFYLGKHAKINIVPLLFAEFFAANSLSMFFYIDNPTNIMIANSLGISFLEYARVMWLPTLVAGSANLILLYVFFRKLITVKFDLEARSEYAIRNWFDAAISSVMLLLMFIFLVLSEKMEFAVWQVTATFAILFMVEDILFGNFYFFKEQKMSEVQLEKGSDVHGVPKEEHEFWIALKRVPWKIFPFIFTFFVLVAALGEHGVISALSGYLSDLSSGLLSGIFVNGIVGLILANIINNQPMAILFSNVFVNGSFALSDAAFKGSAYAVIIASNLGANITIMGALAGLMWKKILRTKGVYISYMQFFKVGITITPVVFILSLITLFFVLR